MFSGRHELKKMNGKVFIDRDADVFKEVISTLRNNMQIPVKMNEVLKEKFDKELDFWGLVYKSDYV